MISAVAGYINSIDKISSSLLEKMSATIIHSDESRINNRVDQILAISATSYKNNLISGPLIFNADKTVGLCLRGEIFDYQQQKSELVSLGYTFESSDNHAAEFCLHLYQAKGDVAFKELNGSFGLIIYDIKKSELLLVSDRFASQPLFYSLSTKKTLLFSSQVAAILESTEVNSELNMNAVFEYFTFLQVLGVKTFCKNINMLKPATVLKYKNGTISHSQYWSFNYHERKASEQYYVERLAQTIKKAVQRRTQGNERLGLLLSGGLDSRIILAAADKNMVCFTVGDFENEEVKTAKKIAQAKGCKHVFLKRDVDHYVNLIEKAVDIGDGMYCFTHAYAIGFFDQIRKECDTVFHGYGLERFFRGTMLARRNFSLAGIPVLNWLDNLCGDSLALQIIHKFKTSFYKLNPAQLFLKENSQNFKQSLNASVNAVIAESEEMCEYKQDKFVWPNTRYPQGFAFLNVSSLRAFMPERSIVFDNDLIDLHLQMPLKYRASSRIWEKVIYRLNKNIANVPKANPDLRIWQRVGDKLGLSRKVELPSPTFTQGSWPDFLIFIRHHEKMRNKINRVINDPESINPEIFDLSRIKQIFDAYMQGKNEYSIFLYFLLTFGTWYKKQGFRQELGNQNYHRSQANE